MDASYIADVYDELLTQAEIQGNINKVNGTSVACEVMLVCHVFDRNVKCSMSVSSVCCVSGECHFLTLYS